MSVQGVDVMPQHIPSENKSCHERTDIVSNSLAPQNSDEPITLPYDLEHTSQSTILTISNQISGPGAISSTTLITQEAELLGSNTVIPILHHHYPYRFLHDLEAGNKDGKSAQLSEPSILNPESTTVILNDQPLSYKSDCNETTAGYGSIFPQLIEGLEFDHHNRRIATDQIVMDEKAARGAVSVGNGDKRHLNIQK